MTEIDIAKTLERFPTILTRLAASEQGAHRMTQSVLAAQRAEDEALSEELMSLYAEKPVEVARVADAAAARIRALSQELAEASHDRDRYQADLERLRKQVQWQLV